MQNVLNSCLKVALDSSQRKRSSLLSRQAVGESVAKPLWCASQCRKSIFLRDLFKIGVKNECSSRTKWCPFQVLREQSDRHPQHPESHGEARMQVSPHEPTALRVFFLLFVFFFHLEVPYHTN